MLRSLSLSVSRFAFVSILAFGVGLDARAVDPTKPDPRVKSEEYPLPEFSNTKMPSITSCDPKNPLGDKNLMTGNGFLDAALSTTKAVKGAFDKEEMDDADSDEDVEDVDGKATLSTDCEKLYGGERSRTNYDAEKMQCGQFKNNANLLADIEAAVNAEKRFLACQRGVMGALGGEIACFRKQIVEAEQYMSALISQPGGLADMLKQGNDQVTEIDKEVQDRETQFKDVSRRLDGGPGGNPPGMLKAKETVTQMMADLTVQSDAVKTQVANLRSQEQRFETLVKQATMARAMECMSQPVAGYSCVANNSSSANYPAGDVSPIDYIKCRYAQSANKLVGGKRVLNVKREQAMKTEADAIFKQIAGFHSPNTNLPEYNDKDGYAKSMKVYKANTPDELLALVNGTFNSMQGKGSGSGDFYNQFARDLRRCYFRSSNKTLANDNSAQAQIERERQDANSPIRASQEAMKQAFTKTQADLGAKFRSLHSTYREALRALTGDSKTFGSADACAAGSLEAQASCMDAFTSMAGSLVTGKVQPPKAALGKEALALTGGMNPPHQFASVVMATNNTQRSVAVNCAGLDDCVAQYTNLRTTLENVVTERKNFQKTFKVQVNNQIQNAARDMAAKDTGTNFNLNKLAGAIQARKDDLLTAFSRLKVDGGIDLDPRTAEAPTPGEGEMFKPSDLNGLVLSQIVPQLPDSNSKGFSDSLSAIKKRDDDLEKKQDDLDKTLSQAEAKKAECDKDARKLAKEEAEKICTMAREDWQKCVDSGKNDNLNNLMQFVVADKLSPGAKNTGADVPKTPPLATADASCAKLYEARERSCGDYNDLVHNVSKDDQETGGKQRSDALRTRTGT